MSDTTELADVVDTNEYEGVNLFEELYLLLKDLYSTFIVQQMHTMGIIKDEPYKEYLVRWANNLKIVREEPNEEEQSDG